MRFTELKCNLRIIVGVCLNEITRISFRNEEIRRIWNIRLECTQNPVILSYCDLIFHRLSAQFRETGVYT